MDDRTVFDETENRIVRMRDPGVERPILMVLDGGDLKNRYPLTVREMSIGRDLGCGIILNDAKVSRRHAKLTYENFDRPEEEPKVVLLDLGSTNGICVNGEQVTEAELHDRDKVMIGSTLFGFFLRDETTIKADETLIRLASRDSLTGLSNRGVFNVEIDREFSRARRYQRPITLILFDIDHFKKFNDTYGHQVGDHVLREMGTLLRHSCRSNDLSARYGGEEFAILLPETPLENALIKAERLRKSISQHAFSSEATRLSVTVSVGVAALDNSMAKQEDLIGAADKALYAAKEGGRNQVRWHSTSNETIREIRDVG